MSRVFVVTEAYGAGAVAEVFTEWEPAIAYARQRFANYDRCEMRYSTVDEHSYAEFHARWDPGTERPDVARRVDISVWGREVHDPAAERSRDIAGLMELEATVARLRAKLGLGEDDVRPK